MARIIISILFCLSFAFKTNAQDYLLSSEYLSTTPADILLLFGLADATYDVESYKLVYNTTDANGNPTIASGILCLPVLPPCNEMPVAIYCHGTVLAKNDVPSAENFESLVPKFLASAGYIGLAPDYVGLGDSPGLHPYIHAQSEATATIDLVRAARELLPTLSIAENGQVFITGYSQGGHAAMATHKYIQEHEMGDEFNVVASAPASGPYNLSGSQAEVLLSGEPYSNPGYIVYILMSYNLAYNNLYTELGDIIQPPYAENVLPYFDGEQDEYDMGTVNSLLPATLPDLFVDSVYTNFSTNPQHPLWQDLRDNDNYDWAPQVPMRMYYCTGDEQVDYHNALDADSAMQANGASDVAAVNVGSNLLHGDCVLPALTAAFGFFAQYADFCTNTGLTRAKPEIQWNAFPNPAYDQLTISYQGTKGLLDIFDMNGRKVFSKTLTAPGQVSLSSLPSGSYIARFETASGTGVQRLVVAQRH